MKPHKMVGPVARQLLTLFDGVIIGSSAHYIAVCGEGYSCVPRDLDIVIPIDRWVEASKLIPHHATCNSFGGFKFTDGKWEVDVWADDVARLYFKYQNGMLYSLNQKKLICIACVGV